MESKQIIKGSLQTMILNMLEQHGSMYGYEMTKYVRKQSQGKMVLTEAALYPALHKLSEAGLLSAVYKTADGRTRKYYFLTPQGKKKSKELTQALHQAIDTLLHILNPKQAYG